MMRGRVVVFIACAAALVATQIAAFGAQSSVPKLSGEHLTSAKGTGGASSKCDAASGSFTFTTSGSAAGPYAGTFTATGKVTVSDYAPTIFSATIHVASTSGRVTINESLVKSASNKGFCLPGYGLAGLSANFSASVVANGHTTRQTGTSTVAASGGSASSSGLDLLLY
jgi:hypothetical protein